MPSEQTGESELKCEICGQPAIGVASTLMPYSCAYCIECARRFAQPKIVFVCLFEDFAQGSLLRDEVMDLETYENGRYITFRVWAKTHSTTSDPSVRPRGERQDD
jgi:hypothetical protein